MADFAPFAGGRSSHDRRQQAPTKIARVVPEISSRRDRQTDRYTDILITILAHPLRGLARR